MFDYKGLIFDLDGTIAESLYVWKKVDIDFFGKRGLTIPENYSEKISSMSFIQAATFTKNEYNFEEDVQDIMDEWYSMAINEYSQNVRPKPFVTEFIQEAKSKGSKIALCTASPKELYEPFLKNNNLYQYFDVFVSGTEVDRGKEYPDIYLLTAKKLGIKPEECIVFEDILKAIKGAKSANMKIIGVFDKESAKDSQKIKEQADGFIYDFSKESFENLNFNE